MKGIIALFLAAIVANFAVAHGSHGSGDGESQGLSAGYEFGLDIDLPADEDVTEIAPFSSLSLSYCESFFDDKLDFDIGLSYIFTHKKGDFELDPPPSLKGEGSPPDPSYEGDFFQQILCLEAGIAYSLDLDYFTTLSFSLENETDFYLAPRMDGENNIEGELTPGIKLNRNGSFGDIYVGCGIPLQYVSYFKDEEFGIGSDVSIGWQSKFGLGLEFIGHFALTEDAGFEDVDAIVSYELPVKNFTFYINCEFEGIGSEEGLCIIPAIGIKYTF